MVRCSNLYPRQLLACSAKLVHMAHRGECIQVHSHRAVGDLKRGVGNARIQFAHNRPWSAKAGAGNECHVAFSRCDRLCGVRNQIQIGRAPCIGGIGMRDGQPHVVNHVDAA